MIPQFSEIVIPKFLEKKKKEKFCSHYVFLDFRTDKSKK